METQHVRESSVVTKKPRRLPKQVDGAGTEKRPNPIRASRMKNMRRLSQQIAARGEDLVPSILSPKQVH